MNIAVTGGNGFIGRRLIDSLSRQGHGIKVLSRRSSALFPTGVQLVPGDLTSATCPLNQFLEGCELVFHCAGELRDVAVMQALHVDGTQRLLQAALNEAARRKIVMPWVQLSSVGAYGFPAEYATTERIVTEETPSQPAGVYEVTKTQSDEMVIRTQETGLIACSIVRPSKVFGLGMSNQSVRSLGELIRKGRFFYIGRPGAVATYVHVDDLVEVLRLCGSMACARGQIYNVSNDCLLEEMVEGIASALGVRPPRIRLPELFVRTAVRTASKFIRIPLTQEQISGLVRKTRYPYRKIEQELGFAPRRSLPDSIGELMKNGAF